MSIISSYRYFFLLLLLPLFFSCANVGKVTYSTNLPDSVFKKQTEILDPLIGKNDILSIAVSSMNPEASAMFNSPNCSGASFISSSSSTGGATGGYLVNEDGNIHFPILGQMKVEGLTKKQLSAHITKQLMDKKLLLDPIVSIRQLNFHVTVLGEVGHPTVITVPSEKINIMEALGMAGDMTIFANRDNVLLIREENGNKIVKRINLNSSNSLASPYYNLKSGDVIYTEPNKTKIRSTSEGRQILPIVMTGLSVAVIVLDRLIN